MTAKGLLLAPALTLPLAGIAALVSTAMAQPLPSAKQKDEPENSCLLVRSIRDHRVPQKGVLEFRVKANSYVRVHFRDECRGLKNSSQISYRSVSSKLCRGDEIRILASLGSSADVTDICYVTGFSPVAAQGDP
ncbi:hypothetical protein ACR9YC_11235 [Parasphingorhabdus sp. DH2-15]|uniref:hypothetical protein n=1 Tax=Parasphingorhabdus sp. DH2-15 TaxID=3444112 RepID=UPI003F68227E